MAKNKLTSAASSAPEVAQPYKPSKEDEARERKYRAEDAIRTLTRAEEIKGDKGLMRDVKAHASKQAEHMGKIAKGKC